MDRGNLSRPVLVTLFIAFITILWMLLNDRGLSAAPILLAVTVAAFVSILWDRLSDRPGDIIVADKIFLFFFGYYALSGYVIQALRLSDVFQANVFATTYDDLLVDIRPLVCIALGLFGVVLAMKGPFAAKLVARIPVYSADWDERKSLFAGCGLLLVGGILIGILVNSVGINAYMNASYVDTYGYELGKGYLTAGMFIIQLGIMVLFLRKARPGVMPPVVPTLIFLLFAAVNLRIGRRRIVFEEALGIITIYHYCVRRINWKLLVPFGAAAFILITMLGQVRGVMEQGITGMIEQGKNDFSMEDIWHGFEESSAVPYSVARMVEYVPQYEPYRYGMTYVKAFDQLVPLAIHPQRAQAPSEWFVWAVAPGIATKFGGLSFSHIAEGYWNFGYLGAFFSMFVIALLVRTMVTYRRANMHRLSGVLLYAVFMTTQISLNRGDSNVLLKTVVCTWVPALFIAYFLGHAESESKKSLV